MDYIESKDLRLDEFLRILFSKDAKNLFPNNCFPTKEMGNLFINDINIVSEENVKNILRAFLVHNSTYGIDHIYAQILLDQIRNKEVSLKSERHRKLLYLSQDENFLVWEGITWILDLLPNQPKIALQVLNVYLMANFGTLPDYAISGILDSLAIIRAKFVNYQQRQDIFLDISHLDFEVLISKLYEKLGYDVDLTKKSHDGGIDIISIKNTLGEKELVLIQCKRRDKKKITVKEVRDLLGTISHSKATKGVFVSSTDFTKPAIKFANENPSLELIGGKSLVLLLNENFGVHWYYRLDSIIKYY